MIVIWQTRRIFNGSFYVACIEILVSIKIAKFLESRELYQVSRESRAVSRILVESERNFLRKNTFDLFEEITSWMLLPVPRTFKTKEDSPNKERALHSTPKMGKKRTKEGNRRHIWLECFKWHGVWNCTRTFAAKVDLIEKTNVKNCSTVDKCET